MNTEFPTLADVVFDHGFAGSGHNGQCDCGDMTTGPSEPDWYPYDMGCHSRHVEQVWREACTIRTSDQINDYWPTSTVIREEPANEYDFYPQIWEMAYQCGWTRAGEKYNPDDDSPRLPALLIWHPGWAS